MLKLYTDKTFLTESYRKYVFPLLFDLHYVKHEVLFDYYTLEDSILNADIVVFPVDYSTFYKNQKAFKKLNQEAKINNKPIWLYTAGDFGFTVHIPNSYNFRLGGFDSKLNNNTFILPSFVNNPYKTILKQPFSTLNKKEKPDIGFVGHANSGVLNYFKSYLSYLRLRLKRLRKLNYFDKQPFYPSSIKRSAYLNKLSLSKNLNTNFILRKKYRAGVSNQLDKAKTTEEFYNNIYNNLYTFCIRGVGNFSVRFYETLAVGRIPVLLNTDCRLPLNQDIQWERHAIIIDESEEETIETQICNFHNSKSNEEIKKIQEHNKMLWETHLQRHSYFIKVHDMFINKRNNE